MRDAVVADIVDEMEKVTAETPAQEAEENEVEVNEETVRFRNQLFLCNLPDASSHLQRALHVFREATSRISALL